jgi:hypothetical protein
MDIEGSATCQEWLAIELCHVPIESCPHPYTYFFKISLNIILQLCMFILPGGLFPSGFPTKILYRFLISTGVKHSFRVLLDLIQ